MSVIKKEVKSLEVGRHAGEHSTRKESPAVTAIGTAGHNVQAQQPAGHTMCNFSKLLETIGRKARGLQREDARPARLPDPLHPNHADKYV